DQDYFSVPYTSPAFPPYYDTLIVQVHAARFGSSLHATATLFDGARCSYSTCIWGQHRLAQADYSAGSDPVITFAIPKPWPDSLSPSGSVLRVSSSNTAPSTGPYTVLWYLCKSGGTHNVSCRA